MIQDVKDGPLRAPGLFVYALTFRTGESDLHGDFFDEKN